MLDNIIGIVSILVGAFIAYHVYFLSKKLTLKDRLVRKDEIKKQVEPKLTQIRQGFNSKVEIINFKKFQRFYPHNNESNKDGYTYMGAELKAVRFDGVEFFCAVKELYVDDDGSLSLEDGKHKTRHKKNALEAGVVPYEWIEYIDPGGDEFSYRFQFFVKFSGINKSPYKYFNYYVESDHYNKEHDPLDLKWSQIHL